MFYNMSFTNEDPRFLFTESNKVLKNNGLLYFSVRSDNDFYTIKARKYTVIFMKI